MPDPERMANGRFRRPLLFDGQAWSVATSLKQIAERAPGLTAPGRRLMFCA